MRTKIIQKVFRHVPTPPAVTEMVDSLSQKKREALAETDKKLAANEAAIRADGVSRHNLCQLKKEQGNLRKQRERLNAELESISRLKDGVRMGDVYELLEAEGFDDDDWRLFIYAVLSARIDFRGIRNRVERAIHLSRQIARTAEKLSRQIKELGALECGIPYELVSTQALLKQSGNSFPDAGREWEEWARPILLEGLPGLRDDMRRAWESVPGLTDLLATIARLCREFKPRPRVAAAAVRSRKSGDKAETIRLLADTLTRYGGFELTPRLMRAMAITLTVYFDDPDDEVSYEQVRQATAGFQPIVWTKEKPIPPSRGKTEGDP